MQFWILAPWLSAEELVEIAPHAEELGFQGLMGADHAFVPQVMAPGYPYSPDGVPPISGELPYPDVWTSIAAMAMVTRRLLLSTAVYILPLRHPIEVAKATGTLARLSQGRFVLGAGAGWMREEFQVYGVDFSSRGRRLDESLELLRKLWRGGYVEHHGEFFDFPPLQLAPAPQQDIPVYIGGSSDRALRRAARLAQGWIGTGHTVAELPQLIRRLRDYRASSERAGEDFTILGTPSDLRSPEQLQELEECGMNALSFGFAYSGASSQTERLRAMEHFAARMISTRRSH